MPQLYTSLANGGAKVVYVTGAPDIVIDKLNVDRIPHKVISTNNFPKGDIFLHQLGESTEDFKVATICRLYER
jgi:hypothetical protein